MGKWIFQSHSNSTLKNQLSYKFELLGLFLLTTDSEKIPADKRTELYNRTFVHLVRIVEACA